TPNFTAPERKAMRSKFIVSSSFLECRTPRRGTERTGALAAAADAGHHAGVRGIGFLCCGRLFGRHTGRGGGLIIIGWFNVCGWFGSSSLLSFEPVVFRHRFALEVIESERDFTFSRFLFGIETLGIGAPVEAIER